MLNKKKCVVWTTITLLMLACHAYAADDADTSATAQPDTPAESTRTDAGVNKAGNTSPQSRTQAANDSVVLDTITVTAQKQDRDLQETPASVSVFNSGFLEDKNIEKMSRLGAYIPNFVTFQTNGISGLSNPNIRGLSSSLQASMVSVPILVDGVPITSSYGYDLSLLDIENVQVLRGPQSTFYGAGAEAGAIVITTKKPGNEARGKLTAEFGSDNKVKYSFSTSGALVKDKFYIGVAGEHYEKDGYIQNTNTGTTTNDKENNFGKLYLRYTPNDRLDLSFVSSRYQSDDGSRNANLIYQEPTVTSNLQGYTKFDSFLNALKVDYDFDTCKFESITTSSNSSLSFMDDFDYTDQTTLHSGYPDIDMDKVAQEFRLSSGKGRLNWLVGAYGDHQKHYYHQETHKLKSGTLAHSQAFQDLTMGSLGVFAHASWEITPKWSIASGIRFDTVEKTFEQAAKNLDLKETYEEISPKLSLSFKINDMFMTYATVAKGFNPGGFNHNNTDTNQISFGSERLISYETGLKSSFFNNRVTMNTALFYIDISNLHTVNYISATSCIRSNDAKAVSKGVEVELNARVTRDVSVFANYGYTDCRFDEYSDIKGDYSGNRKSYSPLYNYSFGVQFRHPSGYFARADMTGYGNMYIDDANRYERDAYYLVNAKVGYETTHYEIYFYGRNLFDEAYYADGFANGKYTIYSEPREVGVQLVYRF